MKFSVNEAKLLGNVTRAIELKFTPSGNQVASFSMATNRSYMDKQTNTWTDIGTFHNIVVWGKLAEFIAKSISKGDKVYVSGRIENRSYTNKQGLKVYISEIVAEDVISLNKKKSVYDESPPLVEDVGFDAFEATFGEHPGGEPIEEPARENPTPF